MEQGGRDRTAILPRVRPSRPERVREQARTGATALGLGLAVSLAAGLGNVLLWRFSQFGERPYDVLPIAAILTFGLLFTGLLLDLRPDRASGIAGPQLHRLGGLLGVVFVAVVEPRYAIAPVAAWLVAEGLNLLPRRLGGMLGAMLTYIACTVLANFTLDSFIPIGTFFLLNVGTLFFGITFTQRDRVHAFGRGPVYSMIGVAVIANVIAALALDTPLRYVGVSMLSILMSETADTEVYQRLLRRPWLTRVVSSNAVSAPLDTLVFTLLAFGGEPFATAAWLTRVILTDVLVKFASGLAAALGLMGLARFLGERALHVLGSASHDRPARNQS